MKPADHLLLNRRHALKSLACGFGYLALAGLAQDQAAGTPGQPLAPRPPHHSPQARRVIFLFMQGGPSHVDTFDYKPLLGQQDGQMRTFDDARVLAQTGTITEHRVMKNLWPFHRHGECGRWVSALFPHQARHVDDLCFLHGLHTNGIAHGPATLFLHTGSINLVRPSVGSWVLYGLGTENQNLPGFITICPSMGNGGPRNWSNAFLPAIYQGTPIGRSGLPATQATIQHLGNGQLSPAVQQQQFQYLQAVNDAQLQQAAGAAGDPELEAVISSYQLAFAMQTHAPAVLDLSTESASTLRLYGIGEDPTDNFGRQCLLARRFAEAGVRYIQATYGDNTNNPAWDQHSDLPRHAIHARAVDKPVAGLLQDLKQRGLLEDTLVWFGGEFGRTPYAERNGTGRDHNPYGFTMWLAGGGVQAGFAHGETDEYGHHAVSGTVHMHDLHATLLWLLGLDHTQLTFTYDGRPFRLTDVHGEVVHEIFS
jgi:hypothetical protein